MSIDSNAMWRDVGSRDAHELGVFARASVVELIGSDPLAGDALVAELHPARVTVTKQQVIATGDEGEWAWHVDDLEAVIHARAEPWTIFVVPEIGEFGVSVAAADVAEFRRAVDRFAGAKVGHQRDVERVAAPTESIAPLLLLESIEPLPAIEIKQAEITNRMPIVPAAPPSPPMQIAPPPQKMPPPLHRLPPPLPAVVVERAFVFEPTPVVTRVAQPPNARSRRPRIRGRTVAITMADIVPPDLSLAGIDARNISAWFGSHQVLDRVSLDMQAGKVTALIGPSGCGKSTFLRILNRMHEMIPGAAMGGEVLVDGHDIYDPERKLTDARREVGMVFQKPNPFPAMSIYDNVLASCRLTGVKVTGELKDEIVQTCLIKAGLWNEVKDRLRQPGGGLSGGQQQRLCIARALAIKPRVLLMDEPCSALDPTSTRRIEETVKQIVSEVTIVIVTHNMQQAARVSNHCAFFLAEQGTPGVIVEHGPTEAMFDNPQDPRTSDYVLGRFG